MVIWLVGLSGSGKTTIGTEVYRLWKKKEANTVLLDGDHIRKIMQNDKTSADYSMQGRKLNANRIVEICSWLDQQNINVVCCILCVFNDIMSENYKRFSQYFQVHLDVSMTTLETRDPKKLYYNARAGHEKNVIGVDLDYVPPEVSDLCLSTEPGAPDALQHAENILFSAGITQ